MRTVCIIPARWGSTRFPGKPLAPIVGATGVSTPLILRTLELTTKADCFDAVYVATDDDRISQVVLDAGWDCIMTNERNRNGTERCAEASIILDLHNDDLVVNLQGDSVLTPPSWLSALVSYMKGRPLAPVATCIYPRGAFETPSPGDVEAIVDKDYRALYFTRGPIPTSPDGRYQHFGIYAYCVWALRKYARTTPTRREQAEILEQLRLLESGNGISCIQPPGGVYPEREVNYPNDVAAVEEVLKKWNIE